MKFSIKDFFSKCDHSVNVKKPLMVNFIFCPAIVFWIVIKNDFVHHNPANND